MSAMTAGSPGFSSPGATALTDVAATDLAGEHSCHRLHRRAARRGGGVDDRQRRADGRAGEVDDRSSVTEVPRCLPVDEERAPHVGPLQGIEPVEVMVGHRTEDDLAGRVDQDVDAPEGLGRLHEHPFDVELVGDFGAGS